MTGTVKRRVRNLALGAVALFVALPATAAEIVLETSETGADRIVIRGDLDEGDAARFAALAEPLGAATVLLQSPGGVVAEGIAIGRQVRAADFATAIPGSTACASACALVWIGGRDRAMAETALVGFFGPFGRGEAVGPEVRSYLRGLGIRPGSAAFSAFGGPLDRDWRNPANVRALGLTVRSFGETADAPGAGAASGAPWSGELSLPDGQRWIVLQSARTAGALAEIDERAITVRAQNGFFARVIGPFDEAEARQQLRVNRALPRDAYLSRGRRFMFVVEDGS